MDFFQKIFKGDRVIWLIFTVLSAISIVEFFSSSSLLITSGGNHWSPLTRHLTMLFLGFIVMLVVQSSNYIQLRFFLPVVLGFIAFVTLIYAAAKGQSGEMMNGASRWIRIPVLGITFQPSEMAKLALIAITAHILAKNSNPKKRNDLKAYLRIIGFSILFVLPILTENFSTAFLISIVITLMIIAGGIHWKYLFITAIGATILLSSGYLLIKAYPDQKVFHRATTWVNRFESYNNKQKVPPAEFDMDKDAQRGHASIAITKGNIIGVGPGNSTQREFLTHAYSDLIFAIIVEESGLIGAAIVILMYIFLACRAVSISSQTDDVFAALLVQGISLMIVLQAIIHFCVCVDIIPITGQPLPFISKGGTSMILNCFELGILLSVSNGIKKEKAAKAKALEAVETETTLESTTLA